MTDDILVHIARFLPTAKDLSALGLTCPRFAAKMIPAPVSAAAAAGVASGEAAAPEMLSIMEEAGRFWVTCCSVQERGWVACREPESWLGLMHDVELLLAPLAFGRAHADFTLSEGGAVATMSGEDSFQPASSKVVMRSGRHFAQFTVMEGDMMNLGVIRPDWDVEGAVGALARTVWVATASTARTSGAATPAAATGRAGRARASRANVSACCSNSTRAA